MIIQECDTCCGCGKKDAGLFAVTDEGLKIFRRSTNCSTCGGKGIVKVEILSDEEEARYKQRLWEVLI